MPEIERITSRDNQRLIAARKVRDGKDRSRIFIEGHRLVAEALRSNIEIEECFVSDTLLDDEILNRIDDITTVGLSEKLLASIADTKTPQGIVAISKRPIGGLTAIEQRVADESTLPVVVFLQAINNPSNLGAVLRTAEAADVAGVIISPGSADAFSPKALRAAMGATFRLPIAEQVELDAAIDWAATNKLETTAADIKATKSYTEIDWRQPRILILGSEAHGLTESDLSSIKSKIYIPMTNSVESLNLAVSAGVLLFEAKRQNDLSD